MKMFQCYNTKCHLNKWDIIPIKCMSIRTLKCDKGFKLYLNSLTVQFLLMEGCQIQVNIIPLNTFVTAYHF